MRRKNRSVFLSYRHKVSDSEAQALRLYLLQKGYDVFVDVTDMPSGKFEPNTHKEIEARTFFLPILMPETLRRCINEDGSPNAEDWIGRENEHAVTTGRHIIPALMSGFDFDKNRAYLTGSFAELGSYQRTCIHQDFLEGFGGLDQPMTKHLSDEAELITANTDPSDSAASITFQTGDFSDKLPPEQQQAHDLYEKAMCQLEEGNLNGAIRLFTDSIHLAPNFPPAYGHRAIAKKRYSS
jgi:hypothetical protein